MKLSHRPATKEIHLTGNTGTKKERATEDLIQKRYALQLAKKDENGAHVAVNIARSKQDAANEEAARLLAYSYMQTQELVLLREEKVLQNTSIAVAKAHPSSA